jgi:hypothetical protein
MKALARHAPAQRPLKSETLALPVAFGGLRVSRSPIAAEREPGVL